MFGKATIRLGIGPHSSLILCYKYLHGLIETDNRFFTCSRVTYDKKQWLETIQSITERSLPIVLSTFEFFT